MIKTYEWNDEKLYGQFQALKNQLVNPNAGSDRGSHKKTQMHIEAYMDKLRLRRERLTWMLSMLAGTAT